MQNTKTLFIRVGMKIEINPDKVKDPEEVFRSILNGTMSGETYAPEGFGLDEDEENGWISEELCYEFSASMQQSILDDASTEMLIAELNKRGLKVKDNNNTSSGETYLVTIDHVDGPYTQLCDTEANAKAFVFGHITGYESFEEFDAALKSSIDAIEGLIDYTITKREGVIDNHEEMALKHEDNSVEINHYKDLQDFLASLDNTEYEVGSRMKQLNIWYVIDSATNQRSMKLDEERFLYKENRVDPKSGETFEYESEMRLSDYTEDDLERGIEGYYKSLDEVKRIYTYDWKQIVLECIFEQEDSDIELGY